MRAGICCSALSGLVLVIGLATEGTGAPPPAREVRIAAVCQTWADEGRTIESVLAAIDRAAQERAQVVCLPQECVRSEGGADAAAALAAISKAAAAKKLYVAACLKEQVPADVKEPAGKEQAGKEQAGKEQGGGKCYLTSYLIGPDGAVVGKYRKSHRLPDEPIALGDSLPVFETPLGKIGLMVGTDHYWPEIPLVLALEGAELILWSNGVEPVPQSYPMDVTPRVRAIDNHVTIAAASYVGDLPYLCSNYPNYTGSPLGRACVVDRNGIVVADTSIRPGVAVAAIDLARRKDIYYLTFVEDRGLFHYLSDREVKVVQSKPVKRKIRVAIAQVGFAHGPNPAADSFFAKILDEAGGRGADVIVMAEFGFPTDTEAAKKAFAIVSNVCRKYKTYAIIGGLNEPQMPNKNGGRTSWAFLWDRQGEVVGKYRISQYGLSTELPVFATDFGTIGIILCGDIYSPEITRAMALQGAEMIFCPSQSWGASGLVNQWMQQARAIDNAVWMVPAHFPMTDAAQRSYVVDPYGFLVAAAGYCSEGVVTADVDLDAGRVWFARTDKPGTAGRPGYLAGYYPRTVPEKRTDFRSVLLAGRRPELYGAIPKKTLADRHIAEDVWKRMSEPRK